MSHFRPCFAFAVIAISSNVLAHDDWDPAGATDQTSATTRNLLLHAAPAQEHDLQNQSSVPDHDWFVLNVTGNRSFEVRIVNTTRTTLTADPTNLRRHAADGSVLQTSVPLGTSTNAYARTLRWIEASRPVSTHIHVTNADPVNPTLPAGANAKYTIKLYETTLYCPRYNNSGSQVSVLIVQHSAPEVGSCSYTARFNAANGTETGATTLALDTEQMSVINTAALTGLPGTSGSAFIAHTCGVGGLKAKLVALEPATGFSFDTACSMREL